MMNLSESKKRRIIIVGTILLPIIVVVFIANIVLGNFIERKLNNLFPDLENRPYHLSVKEVRTNIFRGNIRFSNIQLIPDSMSLVKARNGNATSSMVFEFYIAELQLAQLNLISALTRKHIDIGKIELINPKITIYKGKQSDANSETPKLKFDHDSIQIKGISKFELGKVILNHSKITLVDLISSDTFMVNKALKTEIEGVELSQISRSKDLFKLHLENFAIEVNDEQIWMPGKDYQLALKRINFEAKNGELILNELTITPTDEDVYRLARKLHFTTEIFNIDVDKIHLKKLKVHDIIKHQYLLTDSILVSGLNLSILMDKRLLFNTAKRPLLPNQLLKSLKIPIYIRNLQIEKSNLTYQERMPGIKEPMTVTLNNLNAKIKRVTSVKDSLTVQQDMTIKLQSDFMNTAKMQIDFIFPLYATSDTFFYSGHLDSAPFSVFNKATVPALGAKFNNGQLQSINFKGSANSVINTGEFTMLYDDLIAEISKKDYRTKNKLFSWAANTVLLNSNPGKNGKTRIAKMQSERNINKGFGNFMWKTFQHGIASTVLPAGKIEKTERKKKKQKQN